MNNDLRIGGPRHLRVSPKLEAFVLRACKGAAAEDLLQALAWGRRDFVTVGDSPGSIAEGAIVGRLA